MLNSFFNKKVIAGLIVIFITAYLLRVFFLPQLALSFYYDTARDAFEATQIIQGNFKVLGPPSSVLGGLHHGVFYYYLLALMYWIGQGSPIVTAYLFAFLNTLTVLIIFCLTFLLTRKTIYAFLAAILFAFSFEATQYAIWLSNPSIAILVVPLGYLGLWIWVHEKKSWGALLAGMGLGLSLQMSIALFYHLLVALTLIFIWRKHIKRIDFIKFLLTFAAFVFTFLIAEIKFNFKGLNGLLSLLGRNDAFLQQKGFRQLLDVYIEHLTNAFAGTFYPQLKDLPQVSMYLAIVLLLVFTFLVKKTWTKEKSVYLFLAFYILSFAIAIPFGGSTSPHLTAGISAGIAILGGIFLGKIWEKSSVVAIALVALILISNLSEISNKNIKGQVMLTIQKDMILKNQLLAVDYTYSSSGGKPFSINSVTSPLWINITWTYLYKWYGVKQYGYPAFWAGVDQIGQLDTLDRKASPEKIHYLIIEPTQGISVDFRDQTISEEDARTILLEEKEFGEIRVQKRESVK